MNERGEKSIPGIVWIMAAVPSLFLLALVLRSSAGCAMPDSQGYLSLAYNLWHHGQFTESSGPVVTAETFRVPGYPLFLLPFVGLFDSPILPAAIAQILLGFCSVLLAWKLFSHFGNRRGALIGTALFAFDWVRVIHTPLLLTETLATFLLLIDTAVTLRTARDPSPLRVLGCGLLWSVTAFVKPVVLYLPLLLVWLWRRHKKCFAAFLVGAYLLPSFWILRNWRIAHFAGFSPQGGIAMLLYPAAGIMELHTGLPLAQADYQLRGALDKAHPEFQYDLVARSRAYGALALSVFKAHPILFIRYNLLGVVRILTGTGLEVLSRYTSDETFEHPSLTFAKVTGTNTFSILKDHPSLWMIWVPYILMLGFTYVLFPFGILRLWNAGRHRAAYVLLCCPIYFLALAAHQGYCRFRIPMLPFLAAGVSAFFP